MARKIFSFNTPPTLKDETISKDSITQQHDRFLLTSDLSFTQQYSHIYHTRLLQQRPKLIRRVLKEWHPFLIGSGINLQDPTTRIVNTPSQTPVVLIGCTFKEMRRRPNFLKDYTKELVSSLEVQAEEDAVVIENIFTDPASSECNFAGIDTESTVDEKYSTGTTGRSFRRLPCYSSPDDFLILEDESGRIRLQGGPDPQKTPTGVCFAVAGSTKSHSRGVFIVEAYLTVYDCKQADDLSPINSDTNLVSPYSGRVHASYIPKYIAFVSGLGMPCLVNEHRTPSFQVLIDFLRGALDGSAEVHQVLCNISHVIVCGGEFLTVQGNVGEWSNPQVSSSTSLRLDSEDFRSERVAMAKTMESVDSLFLPLLESVSVDIMPGASDATNVFFPQQPIHPLLFPRSSRCSTLRLVSNPYAIKIILAQDVNFDENLTTSVQEPELRTIRVLGTSGQNIANVRSYTSSNFAHERHNVSSWGDLDILQQLYKWGHLCPTAPDSLPSYPFTENDPYIIPPDFYDNCPQEFEQDHVAPDGSHKKNKQGFSNDASILFAGCCDRFETSWNAETFCRFLTVPRYCETGSIVLLDVNAPQLDVMPIHLAVG